MFEKLFHIALIIIWIETMLRIVDIRKWRQLSAIDVNLIENSDIRLGVNLSIKNVWVFANIFEIF